jgi:hypothetical protein
MPSRIKLAVSAAIVTLLAADVVRELHFTIHQNKFTNKFPKCIAFLAKICYDILAT